MQDDVAIVVADQACRRSVATVRRDAGAGMHQRERQVDIGVRRLTVAAAH